MSVSSKRGKGLELEVAKILRSKLGARVARDKQSGAGTAKQDIRDYYNDIPFSIECKDQQTIQVKAWMRQAIEASSFNQVPTLVFRSDEEILACVRFADLVNMEAEIRQLRAELADLRKPQVSVHGQVPAKVLGTLTRAVTKKVGFGLKTDANGHIVDDYGYCNQKGCKYSRGYRAPKAKKS